MIQSVCITVVRPKPQGSPFWSWRYDTGENRSTEKRQEKTGQEESGMAKILISPGRYVQGAGEMKKLVTYAAMYGKKALVLIH